MYEMKVSGMNCGHCINSIKNALTTLDPKVKVTVDLSSQTVRIESEKTQDEMTNLILEAGYPVLEVKHSS